MTIKEYFEAWKDFDYYTFMSDDNSVYLRGRREKRRLLELAGSNKVLFEIGEKFVDHDESLGAKPQPKIEDYIGAEEK